MLLVRHIKILFIIICLPLISIFGQNTVGTLLNTANALNGYTLFTFKKETFLINNCGEIINQWSSDFIAGKSVSLLENGNLLRTGVIPNPNNIFLPGIGGKIELFDWNGNLIWQYEYSTNNAVQHHDVLPLPNGNILMLAISVLSETQAIQMGRNPSNLLDSELFNEQIIELKPIGTNNADIVWEWNMKDHLIQDFDNTKDNFGVVSENPQLLNINYLGTSNGAANWLHANAIYYNEQLDQIILSTRQLSEFYIIDHSTTTSEAASSSGGIYQKGGDILYRWGNPAAYMQGTASNQKLFGQHSPRWIDTGLVDAGKIILFNNGLGRTPHFSEIYIINPPTSTPGVYTYIANTAYGPENPDYIYISSPNTNLYSPILSNAQRLSNGNIFICEGTSGHFFEIDANENIVWEYINPVGGNGILSQGDNPQLSNNVVYRAKKYDVNYPAFNGRDLTPGLPIELNPDLSQCSILGVNNIGIENILTFPNPVSDILYINSPSPISNIKVYTILGKMVKKSFDKNQVDLHNLIAGIYIVKLTIGEKIFIKKIIKF